MRIYLTVLLGTLFIFQNCETSSVETLAGNWVEVSTEANRIELSFFDENQLEQKQSDTNARRTFTYEILQDSISLSSNEADMSEPIVVFFEITNYNELHIGNFTSVGTFEDILHFRKAP